MSTFTDIAYLSLDVSTKCTGIAAFNEKGQLIDTCSHSPKVSKKVPDSEHFLIKADGVRQLLKTRYGDSSVKKIWIEAPLQNSVNRNTVNILYRFNGICSSHCHQLFGVIPLYLTVYEWRRKLCPEHLGPGSGKKKGEITWSLPEGTDPKAYLYQKIQQWYPLTYPKVLNPNGDLREETFDQSDAVGVGVAGLLNAGVLDWDTLNKSVNRLTRKKI